MDIFWMVIFILIGFVLIIKGGDLFVESSVNIARILRVSEVIIGATIVSIGTTLPELLTSIIATSKGVATHFDDGYLALAVSNAIGSMLANSGLILALVIIIRPPRYDRTTFDKTSLYVLLISVFLVIFSITDSSINIIEGIVLLLAFIFFVVFNIRSASKEMKGRELVAIPTQGASRLMMIISFIVGMLSIGGGALMLVSNARALALSVGVSTQLVGITLVAIGTSLPELVTSMTALAHKNTDIGVGNIFGAHIINATLIIGIITMIAKGNLPVDSVTRNVSVWVMLAIMAVLILPTIIRRKISRVQGVIMLIIYISNLIYNTCVVVY